MSNVVDSEPLVGDDEFEFSTTSTVWSTALQRNRGSGKGRRQAYGSRSNSSSSFYQRSLSVPQLEQHDELCMTSRHDESQLQPPLRKRVLRRATSAATSSSNRKINERNMKGKTSLSKGLTLLQDERPFIDFNDEVDENCHPNASCLDLSDDQTLQNSISYNAPPRCGKITRSRSVDIKSKDNSIIENKTERFLMEMKPYSKTTRQRSISPAFSLTGSLSGGETFSDLAALSEHIPDGLISTGENIEELHDINDETLTPPYNGLSLSQQSRKRGNIGSPVLDLDEGAFTRDDCFDPLTTSSTCTFDSLGRCRSRSRIFSPEFMNKDVVNSPLNDNASDSSNTVETTADPFNDMRCSLGSDSPNNISCSTHDDDSDSEEEEKGRNQCKSSIAILPLPVRVPSIDARSSTASLNQTFETKEVSNQILKYMYKSLRKLTRSFISKRLPIISTKTFTNSKTITVFPPKDWANETSTSFMNWAADTLGFQVLNLGGNMGVFLQASVEQGVSAYQSVRKELLSRKNGFGQNKKEIDQDTCPTPVGMDISVKKEINLRYLAMSIEKISESNPNPKDDIDSDLLREMNGLSLSRSKAFEEDRYRINKNIDDHSFENCVHDPRRMSTDSTACAHGGQDYIKLCFGGSPDAFPGYAIRPPRLTLPSDKKDQTEKNEYDIVDDDIRSPFQTQPLSSNCSSSKRNSFATTHMSFVETPIPKVMESWGSRPIPCRDWAVSDYCKYESLKPFFLILEEDPHKEIGSYEKVITHGSSSSLFMNHAIAEIAVSSTDLGLDVEFSEKEIIPPVTGKESRKMKRQRASFAKHNRMSLCSALQPHYSLNYDDNLSANRDIVGKKSLQTKRSSIMFSPVAESSPIKNQTIDVLESDSILFKIFSYFSEPEIICSVSLVSTYWFDIAARAQAALMLVSVGCSVSSMVPKGNTNNSDPTFLNNLSKDDISIEDTISDKYESHEVSSIARSMEWDWKQLTDNFPWGCFLSEGAFKRVYRVMNINVMKEEAISVMDIDEINACGNKNVVGTELAVSSLLSSLVRRGVCPNFVKTRRVFTCDYEPPVTLWGDEISKCPQGNSFNPKDKKRKPRKPSSTKIGRYQYIRMELCQHGDAEEFLKKQPKQSIDAEEAKQFLFQMAFSLYVASDKFCLKHYDVKLLNFFMQNIHASVNDIDSLSSESPFTCLRYGLGNHVFALRMPTYRAIIVKLADYGTSAFGMSQDHLSEVTIGQFTTVENTPPEQFILGDAALQGHGHDNFGLGLCMLHLFTGHCPYEEILGDVYCPPTLRNRLGEIWEARKVPHSKSKNLSSHFSYSVLRSLIQIDSTDDDVFDVPYHTLYRYLVLFGIPYDKFGITKNNGKFGGSKKVWDAITSSLTPQDNMTIENDGNKENSRPHRGTGRTNSNQVLKEGVLATEDSIQFQKDRLKFSFDFGNYHLIKEARKKLLTIEGGVDLLKGLVEFNPNKRLTALEVLNSTFMSGLREDNGLVSVRNNDLVYSYMSYAISHRGNF